MREAAMVSVIQGGIWAAAACLVLLLSSSVEAEEKQLVVEHALTLDQSNFTEIVSKHDFILVKFHSPGCGHCKRFAPDYEKAAAALSKLDPPVVLAKVNVRDRANEGLKNTYDINSFPTLKIFRNGGKVIQKYKGTRKPEEMFVYLKKQAGPASLEIKSLQDAQNFIHKKKIFVAGVFKEFSGEEYTNFTRIAEKMRGDYDFGHTLDASFLPYADQVVNAPAVRLIKPFDELFVDFKDFDMDVLETFITEASIPMVTIFNDDDSNFDFIDKFLDIPTTKVLLFVNFSTEHDAFRTIYNDLAHLYKPNEMYFLMGDVDSSESVFKYYHLKVEQAPLVIVQNIDGPKYLKTNVAPDEIAPWLKDYMGGTLKQYIRSEPIPEVNDKPFKVVVLDSLQEMVFNSGKNVLLEFYTPKCNPCIQLFRTLREVAESYEEDEDVVVARLDASANDVQSELFDLQEFPKLYFKSANGNLSEYNGENTKEAIIDFIQNNRGGPAAKISSMDDGQAVKDEL